MIEVSDAGAAPAGSTKVYRHLKQERKLLNKTDAATLFIDIALGAVCHGFESRQLPRMRNCSSEGRATIIEKPS